MDRLGVITGQYGLNYIPISKFGENEAVSTTFEDIGGVGGSLTYFTVPTGLEILSDDAADTVAGTGARTVTVYSLDASYNFQTETVSLNGVTPVPLTKQVMRVWRAFVETAGTGEGAAGAITIRGVGAGANQAIITNGTEKNNQTLSTLFTVPSGYWAVLETMSGGCKKNDNSEVNFQVRNLGGVFQTKFHFMPYQTLHPIPLKVFKKFPPMSDLRMVARTDAGTIHIMASYELTLVKESLVSLAPNVDD